MTMINDYDMVSMPLLDMRGLPSTVYHTSLITVKVIKWTETVNLICIPKAIVFIYLKQISIIGKKRLNYRPSDVLSWLFKY